MVLATNLRRKAPDTGLNGPKRVGQGIERGTAHPRFLIVPPSGLGRTFAVAVDVPSAVARHYRGILFGNGRSS